MKIYYKIVSMTILTIFQSSGIYLVLFNVCQKIILVNIISEISSANLVKTPEPKIPESVVL